MKTNINNFKALYNMQMHKADEIKQLFEKWLPYGYTTEIKEMLKLKGVYRKSQRIREVKGGFFKDHEILNLLIELAYKNKALAEDTEQLLNEKS